MKIIKDGSKSRTQEPEKGGFKIVHKNMFATSYSKNVWKCKPDKYYQFTSLLLKERL